MENSFVHSSRREVRSPAEPLPDDVVARLRSDPAAARAAAEIVAGAFPGLVTWAARVLCGSSNPERSASGGGGERSSDDGGVTAGSNGASCEHDVRPHQGSGQPRTGYLR